MRVAYLGPEGTNSHEAARLRHPGGRHLPQPDLAAVIEALLAGEVDEALLPLENSTEGGVAETLALLVEGPPRPPIVGELTLPIRHHLLAAPGTTPAAITRVLSIPAAAAQCRRRLATVLPGVSVVPALSTAAAAAGCHEPGTAALATTTAASLHGLEVLVADMQDTAANATRFVALGHRPAARTGRDRTSLVFGFGADRAGSLVGALHPFSDRGINLTRIESRPTGEALGRYRFLVDCDGHLDDGPVADALAALGTLVDGLRVLGSYPRGPEAASPG